MKALDSTLKQINDMFTLPVLQPQLVDYVATAEEIRQEVILSYFLIGLNTTLFLATFYQFHKIRQVTK